MNDSFRHKLLIPATLLLIAMQFMPLAFPQLRLWGFNNLLFLPSVFIGIEIALAALLLAVWLVKPLSRLSINIANKTADFLFAGRVYLKWTAFSIICIPVAYFLRIPIHLLGDGQSLIFNIDANLPVIFKWSEMGSIYAAYFVSQITVPLGLGHPAVAYILISILSGAVTCWFFLAISNFIKSDNIERLLVFCLLFLGGWSLLFLGYIENYPILWPFVVAYIFFALRAVIGTGRIIWPVILFAGASLLHLQIFFFSLSLMVIFIGRLEKASLFNKRRNRLYYLVGAVVVMTISAVAYFILSDPELRGNLISLWEGRRGTVDYFLFSPKHLADVVNQLMLLVPTLPLLLLTAKCNWKRLLKPGVDGFLFWMSIGGVGFLFIIEPKLGMGRDWDLFALCGLGPLLLLLRMVPVDNLIKKGLYPVLVILSLAAVLPFYSVFTRQESALAKYEYMLDLDIARARTGLIQLSKIYQNISDSAAADSIKSVVSENFPAYTLVPQALDFVKEGRFAEALAIADRISLTDSGSPEYMNLRGIIYSRQNKFDSALYYLEYSARMERYDYRFLVNLSELYYKMKWYDKEEMVLREAQKLAPNEVAVLNAMMANFFAAKRYDSSIVYARRIDSLNSSPDAIYVMGFSAYEMRQGRLAELYFRKYLEVGDNERKLQQVTDSLQRLQEIKGGQTGQN